MQLQSFACYMAFWSLGFVERGQMKQGTMVSRSARDFHCQSILVLEGNYKLGCALLSRSHLLQRVVPAAWAPQPRPRGSGGPSRPTLSHTDLRARGPRSRGGLHHRPGRAHWAAVTHAGRFHEDAPGIPRGNQAEPKDARVRSKEGPGNARARKVGAEPST